MLETFRKPSPPATDAEIARQAAANAAAWRCDCYAYRRPGYVIYSAGPDLDHPQRKFSHVARYERAGK